MRIVKVIVIITAVTLLLSAIVFAAGLGLSTWTAVTEAIVDADLFAITDVSDETGSTSGTSKKATGTQLKTYFNRANEVVKTSNATLSLDEMTGRFITNYGETDDADLILTASDIDTSIGHTFIYTIVSAMTTNDTCFKAAADNKINFEGTAQTADNGCICNELPGLGDELACYNVTIGASQSNWFCKATMGTWVAVEDNVGDCPD